MLLNEPSDLTSSNEDLTTQTGPASPVSAVVLGHYHLLQKIGEGGMGEVWLAEQKEPVRRRVALKLVKAGMNTREVMARFESERQALALMEHPAIAKVYDAGSTGQGAPYFVMEYVAGVPITEYCDTHRLPITERLELFMQVCEGVRHAHQKAVIHRDLKPSNILVTEVDGRPAPKIIDFGVAKALSQKLTPHTMLTRLGSLVGTPEYMSPEQALSSGEDVDTRTDVYSLGIIFYELLAGVPPIELRRLAFDEYLRRLRDEDPPKPSTKIRTGDAATTTELARKRHTEPLALVKQIGGDLDSIALKALEKDRSRRYSSAADFAADIERYLRHEAVTAVPPSAVYRARKFASRHRWGVVMASAFAIVLTAAASISIRQNVRANRQAIRADREAAVADAVSNFLRNDVLAQASVSNQAGPSTKPDPDLKVRTALDRAAASITGKFQRQPEVEAAIRDTIGQTYTDLGLYPEGESELRGAQEIYAKALGLKDAKTLTAMSHFARTLYFEGKYAESEKMFAEVSELQRVAFGSEDPSTLYSLNGLASAYDALGRYPDAEALHKKILDARLRLIGAEHPETLKSMNNLVLVYEAEGKYPEAEELDNRLLEIRRRVSGPEHPNTLTAMNILGLVYEAEGKYSQAEELDKQLVDIRRRQLGPEHPSTLDSMGNLAVVYQDEGKYGQAQALDEQIIEIRRRVLGANHPDTLMAMNNIAVIYLSLGQYDQAESVDSQVLSIRRRVLSKVHPDVAMSLNNLAIVYSSEGRYSQAESLDNQALEIRRRVYGSEHGDTLMSMNNLGTDYALENKYVQAEALLAQTLEISNRVLGREHPQTLSVIEALADMYQREGKYALAEENASQALAGRRHALGADHPDTLASEVELALARESQGKHLESEPLVREVGERGRRSQPNDWLQFLAESLLGASLTGQRKYVEAEPLLLAGYQGMLAREKQIGAPDRYHLQTARQWILRLYQDWGKPEKASEWRTK